MNRKSLIATADENKGLGTGELDNAFHADLYKFFEQLTLLASAGYKVRGDPTGVDLENVFLGSVGGIYKFKPTSKGGLIFDYRESALIEGESIRELTGFVSQQLSQDWRAQIYAMSGFSDSSPDFGGGVRIKRAF